MTPHPIAAALEEVALALHRLSLAVASDTPTTTPPPPVDRPAPAASDRRCPCGGAVAYQQWTSKAGKDCRAWKCERSRVGEEHYIEWASS